MSFQIEHDDDAMTIIEKICEELNRIGIPVEIKDDDIEHDGYMIYNITKKD